MKILLSLSLLACASLANACAELEVANAWIRMPAPNAKMLAAYMSVKNPSDQSILIQGLSSDAFNVVEMHTSEVVDGVAKMRHNALGSWGIECAITELRIPHQLRGVGRDVIWPHPRRQRHYRAGCGTFCPKTYQHRPNLKSLAARCRGLAHAQCEDTR